MHMYVSISCILPLTPPNTHLSFCLHAYLINFKPTSLLTYVTYVLVCTEYSISGFVSSSSGANGIYTLVEEITFIGAIPAMVPIFYHMYSATEVVFLFALQGPHSSTVNVWVFQKFSIMNAVSYFISFIRSLISALSNISHFAISDMFSLSGILGENNMAFFYSTRACGVDCILQNIGKTSNISQYNTGNFLHPSVTSGKVPP